MSHLRAHHHSRTAAHHHSRTSCINPCSQELRATATIIHAPSALEPMCTMPRSPMPVPSPHTSQPITDTAVKQLPPQQTVHVHHMLSRSCQGAVSMCQPHAINPSELNLFSRHTPVALSLLLLQPCVQTANQSGPDAQSHHTDLQPQMLGAAAALCTITHLGRNHRQSSLYKYKEYGAGQHGRTSPLP
jgi:hypothetical protein